MKPLILLLIVLNIVTTVIAQHTEQQDITSQSYDNQLPPDQSVSMDGPAPKNIILLIGDGMGLTQISSAFYFKESLPHFARFQNIGLMRTSSTFRITDSAAGATAFSAGKKTYNGAIGVDADTNSIPTIVEILSEDGWKSGMVSTSSITHATPASFYAHVVSRGMQDEIAAQLTSSSVGFFAGGGYGFFADSVRSDGKDYLSALKTNGFNVNLETLDTSIEADQKYAYLLGRDALPTILEGRGSFLPDATDLAIKYLSGGGNPFFLMVEGSQIDWGGHGNNAEYLVTEMIDFDDAIGIALDYAENNGNTLVIVTADHETGGFTLASGESYDQIKGTFSTGGHSTTLIPVAAYGPGSELFRGIYENTQIFHKMMHALSKPEIK